MAFSGYLRPGIMNPDIFRCSGCHKYFRGEGFGENRLGVRCKTCLECRGNTARKHCEHGRLRYNCKECGGKGICMHGRRRVICKECKGTGVCEHGKSKYICQICIG